MGVMVAPDYDLDALLPVGLAAQALDVSKQLVNRWRQLGRLKPADFTRSGVALYRYRDVLDAERATRNNPRSSRHRSRR